MAVVDRHRKVRSPWWLSGLLIAALLLIFVGERGFAHASFAGDLSWLGFRVIPAVLITRLWLIIRSSPDWRRVELLSGAYTLGVAVALLCYLSTTADGVEFLGLSEQASIERWTSVMTPIWLLLLLINLLPLIVIEISLGLSGRSSFSTQTSLPNHSVEVVKVRDMASSALSIALATCFLMVTCNIADMRNVRVDVSYFKTSTPGSATIAMVDSMTQPLRILLFFPQGNDVGLEVSDYFRALAEKTNHVSVESLDRLIASKEAKEYKIGQDGVVVFVRGDTYEKFTVGINLKTARRKILRQLDSRVQKSLMAVIRDVKLAYMMVGHGELSDPHYESESASRSPLRRASILKSTLKDLNYKTVNYEGFGRAVPDDCDLLFVLSPKQALMPTELLAIDDYLAGGGAAIFSLDPEAGMRLGILQQRLGLRFNPTPVVDDQQYKVMARNQSDHGLLVSNQFLSHASIPTLSQGSARYGILFVLPGSFEELDLQSTSTKRTQIIRSMSSSFRDIDDADGRHNFIFDAKQETRQNYNLVMAIEATTTGTPDGETGNDMRVIAIADKEVLSDGVLSQVAMAKTMLIDIIKWTGGEEALAGETNSEKDIPIEHTKSRDAIWFYLTILGAPAFVLFFGLVFARRRKYRGRR